MLVRECFSLITLVLISALAPPALAQDTGDAKAAKRKKSTRQIYELRTYVLNEGGDHAVIDAYLEKALIPALGRIGIGPVGVFTELPPAGDVKVERPPMLHVLITYPRMNAWLAQERKLGKDKEYQVAAKAYLNAPKSNPAYARIKTRVFRSFAGWPQVAVGDTSSERIFEMRTYDSHSEHKAKLKVEMFNKAELDVFRNVGFDSVWYGQALAGEDLPSLTYMLRYKDKAERAAQWKKFFEDPGWLVLKGKKRYKNTVSAIEAVFLKPTAYSQI